VCWLFLDDGVLLCLVSFAGVTEDGVHCRKKILLLREFTASRNKMNVSTGKEIATYSMCTQVQSAV
jgi:hypothetical protein